MRKKRISRTKSIRRNMATRAKFILGRHVELGMVYNGCHFSDGTIEPDAYTTVSYDARRRILMLKMIDEESYLMVSGDVSAWRGQLYAQNMFCKFNLAEPVLETVQKYVESHNIEYVTDEVISAAMKARYPKMPISDFNF